MAKRKFYAVKVGKNPSVYGTWDECKMQVDGFIGAKHKSFATLEEAETYLLSSETLCEEKEDKLSTEDFNKLVDSKINALKDDESIAFVDGSYDSKEEKSGFGAIIISYGGNRDTLYKAFTKNLGKEFIELRNVAAELEGVKEAINWAITCKKSKITIFYDYTGIEDWAVGNWKAKKK